MFGTIKPNIIMKQTMIKANIKSKSFTGSIFSKLVSFLLIISLRIINLICAYKAVPAVFALIKASV